MYSSKENKLFHLLQTDSVDINISHLDALVMGHKLDKWGRGESVNDAYKINNIGIRDEMPAWKTAWC